MTTILVLLTVIFWGIAPILDKAALRGGNPLPGTLLRGMVIGLIMAVVTLAGGQFKSLFLLPVRSIVLFVVSGLLAGGLGVFTFYKALQLDSTSRIVPLAATYPLVTALLSVLFLGESITLVRFAGIVLIVAGVWLVK